jgi:hypothetical protein
MEKTKNITLEPKRYNVRKEIMVRGVKVDGSLSPYDIPRQAKISHDEFARIFKIHFVYLTPDEPTSEQKLSPDISVFLGQSSGKLYDIQVREQDVANLPNIKLELVAQIGNLATASEASTPPNYIKELNLLVAKKFLEENPDVYNIIF